jgi:hypothetical protein
MGKRLGRPRVAVDISKMAVLRAQGHSWPSVARELGVGIGTAHAAFQGLSKNPSAAVPATA